MRYLYFIATAILATNSVVAHEMTPTYPKLVPSYVDGLFSAKLTMFNARKDVDYYEVGVFDAYWEPVPFATASKILKVSYGSKKTFEVFVREQDTARVAFVCSLSKLRASDSSQTVVSSKICSRPNGDPP